MLLPHAGLQVLLPTSSQYFSWWLPSDELAVGILSSWVWGHPEQISQKKWVIMKKHVVGKTTQMLKRLRWLKYAYFVPEVYCDCHSTIQQWFNVMPPEGRRKIEITKSFKLWMSKSNFLQFFLSWNYPLFKVSIIKASNRLFGNLKAVQARENKRWQDKKCD